MRCQGRRGRGLLDRFLQEGTERDPYPHCGVQQPDAGPSRLPRHDGRLLARQARAVRLAGTAGRGRQPDDEHGARLAAELQPRRCRRTRPVDDRRARRRRALRVIDWSLTDTGLRFELVERQADGRDCAPQAISPPLVGEYNLYNLLSALAGGARTATTWPAAVAAGCRADAGAGPHAVGLAGRRGRAAAGAGRLLPHARCAREGAAGTASAGRPAWRPAALLWSAAAATAIRASVR